MGSIAIQTHYGDAHNDAGPIGSEPQATDITARRVLLDSEGHVHFGAEESALLYREVIRYLPDDLAALPRFEVKADPEESAIRSGDSLVLTEVPYHNAWAVGAPFKSSWHGHKDMRAEQIARALAERSGSRSDHVGVEAALASLPFDPFETGRFLTAAILAPPTSLAPKPRNLGERARWVFGVCDNVEGCQAALLACERARQLIELTHREQLELGPPGHRRRVTSVVKGEAHQLMLLAIRQALAGPADPADDGISAMKLVEWLFKNHLYNWMRREDCRPPTTPWRD